MIYLRRIFNGLILMLDWISFKFLERTRNVFLIFTLCGLLDDVSTIILIRYFGISVEVNPLTRFGFSYLNYFYFLPHFCVVLFIAFTLSRPSWNETTRFKVKSILLVIYCYVIVINWYQVAMVSHRQILSTIQLLFPL